MEQSKAMEYESRKASSDVLKPRNINKWLYVCQFATSSEVNLLVNQFDI